MRLRFQWALVQGPKPEQRNSWGYQFYTFPARIDGRGEMIYNEISQGFGKEPAPLVRMVIGKIHDVPRLFCVMRSVRIARERTWDGAAWVRDALNALQEDGRAMGTSVLEWDTVKHEVLNYLRYKDGQHRFDGRGNFDTSRPATYDLLRRVEVIP
jgi:hypothetical protein